MSILADGADVVYLIEFFREDGDTHLDAIVDALKGSILGLTYHDLQPLDRETSLLQIRKEQGAVRARARSLALEGRRVEAMKLWRQSFGSSYSEAKAEIERICCE